MDVSVGFVGGAMDAIGCRNVDGSHGSNLNDIHM